MVLLVIVKEGVTLELYIPAKTPVDVVVVFVEKILLVMLIIAGAGVVPVKIP